jgi:outer membrane lipoprotein-sorting protein
MFVTGVQTCALPILSLNRIEIQLKDIEINTGIKDAAFDFSLPEGVNIYEHNF